MKKKESNGCSVAVAGSSQLPNRPSERLGLQRLEVIRLHLKSGATQIGFKSYKYRMKLCKLYGYRCQLDCIYIYILYDKNIILLWYIKHLRPETLSDKL